MARPKPDPALTRRREFGAADGKMLPSSGNLTRTEYLEPGSGLRLRVTAQGSRAWLVSYWSPTAKTQRRLKLGDAATMPLGKARALAREALAAVDHGRDPFAERIAERERQKAGRLERAEDRRRRRAARPAPTVLEVCRAYVQHRRDLPSGRFGRPARAQTVALWDSMIRRHVAPEIGAIAVDKVTAEDVLKALEGAVRRSGPTMGPRLRDFLSAVWRWSAMRPKILGGTVAPIAFAALEKVGHVQQERERVLTPAEVWSFWRASEGEGLLGEALRFSLLTACRVREASALPWSEVDFAAKAWKLPPERSKSGKARDIPLSPQALALLRRVQKSTGKDSNAFGPKTRVSEAAARIRASMGGEHWEPRDLRRSAATYCARLGSDPFTVALTLGHARPDDRMPAVTRTYLRWNYQDKVREALDKLGAWIEETVAAAEAPGAVVEFRR